MNPTDDRPHRPGPEPLWAESYYVDFARPDGLGGFVVLTLYPNLGAAWWWSSFLTPEGLVAVRDHDVALPRAGLEVRADGLWGEMVCETPLEHWSYGMEAFGLRFDDPAEAWAGELGDRMPVGLDLEWELVAPARPGPAPGPPGGCAGQVLQAGRVTGELLLGPARLAVDCPGWRARRWGVCDWWSAASYRWAALSTPAGVPLDPEAVTGAEAVTGGSAPVLVTGPEGRVRRLARALVRADGPAGAGFGWSEWLPPTAGVAAAS